MKKETYFVLEYVIGWLILVIIVGTILQFNDRAFNTDIAEYILCLMMVAFPITYAFGLTKYKLIQQKKRCNDGNQIED